MKKTILILSYLLMTISYAFACHETTVAETSATDNGDGTITYVLNVCMGDEDTWGFVLDFTGGTIVSVNTASITDGGTGGSITPTMLSSTSIEFGDFDNTANPVFHAMGSLQACFPVSVTIAGGATAVAISGTEFTFAGGGPCSGSTTLTSCLPSVSDYVIEITTDVCAGNNISFELQDGVGGVLGSVTSIPTDGTTRSWVWCGGCVDFFEINAPASSGGPPASRCDAGLCCADGTGGYTVYTSGGTVPLVTSAMIGVANERRGIAACTPILLKKLLSFDAKQHGRDIHIEWLTDDVRAGTIFEVQKSKNGIDFETLTSVEQNTAIVGEKAYVVDDITPEPTLIYYRLKYGGQTNVYTYSPIVVVDMRLVEDLASVQLFPNPAKSSFHFYYKTREVVESPLVVQIFDLLGKEVKIQFFDALSSDDLELIEMPISELPTGIYTVRIALDYQYTTRRLIISKR